jgi:hypothetical protein
MIDRIAGLEEKVVAISLVALQIDGQNHLHDQLGINARSMNNRRLSTSRLLQPRSFRMAISTSSSIFFG